MNCIEVFLVMPIHGSIFLLEIDVFGALDNKFLKNTRR